MDILERIFNFFLLIMRKNYKIFDKKKQLVLVWVDENNGVKQEFRDNFYFFDIEI